VYKNLLLLLLSSIVSFAGLEGALRVIMPERLAYIPTLLNNESTYVPNQTQRSRYLEWDYEVRINADGFRNDRTIAELRPGTILALGDSFTEGYGVELASAYPKRLETIVREHDGDGHVYNAGHYDTGLTTYRRVYREIFRQIEAIDRVVIGLFVGNDVLRSATPGDGRLAPGNEFGDGWRYRLKSLLGSHSATYAALNYVVKTNPVLFEACRALGACFQPRPPNIYSAEVIELVVPHTVAYLTDMVREIEADGRTVVVLLIPTREQIDDAFWAEVSTEYGPEGRQHRLSLNKRLAGQLRDNDVDVVDLTDVALNHQRTTSGHLYFRYDGHWNENGHAVAARELARVMLSRQAP
jgi:acyl-CoA thioesterase-1